MFKVYITFTFVAFEIQTKDLLCKFATLLIGYN